MYTNIRGYYVCRELTVVTWYLSYDRFGTARLKLRLVLRLRAVGGSGGARGRGRCVRLVVRVGGSHRGPLRGVRRRSRLSPGFSLSATLLHD